MEGRGRISGVEGSRVDARGAELFAFRCTLHTHRASAGVINSTSAEDASTQAVSPLFIGSIA